MTTNSITSLEWYDVDLEAEVISILMKELYKDGSLNFELLFQYLFSLPSPEIKQFFNNSTKTQLIKFLEKKMLYFSLTGDDVSVQEDFIHPVGTIYPKLCGSVNFLLMCFGSLPYLQIKHYMVFLFEDIYCYLSQINKLNENALLSSIPNIRIDESQGKVVLDRLYAVKTKHLTALDRIVLATICYLDLFGETHFEALLNTIKSLDMEEFSTFLDVSSNDQLKFLENYTAYFRVVKGEKVKLHDNFKLLEHINQKTNMEIRADNTKAHAEPSVLNNLSFNKNMEIIQTESLKNVETKSVTTFTICTASKECLKYPLPINCKKNLQSQQDNLDIKRGIKYCDQSSDKTSAIYKKLSTAVAFLLNCFDSIHYLELKDCISYVMIDLKKYLNQLSTCELSQTFQSIPCIIMDQDGFLKQSQSCQLDTIVVSKEKMLLLFIVYYLASYGKTHYEKLIRDLKAYAPQIISMYICSMETHDQFKYLKIHSRYFSTESTGFVFLPDSFVLSKCEQEHKELSEIESSRKMGSDALTNEIDFQYQDEDKNSLIENSVYQAPNVISKGFNDFLLIGRRVIYGTCFIKRYFIVQQKQTLFQVILQVLMDVKALFFSLETKDKLSFVSDYFLFCFDRTENSVSLLNVSDLETCSVLTAEEREILYFAYSVNCPGKKYYSTLISNFQKHFKYKPDKISSDSDKVKYFKNIATFVKIQSDGIVNPLPLPKLNSDSSFSLSIFQTNKKSVIQPSSKETLSKTCQSLGDDFNSSKENEPLISIAYSSGEQIPSLFSQTPRDINLELNQEKPELLTHSSANSFKSDSVKINPYFIQQTSSKKLKKNKTNRVKCFNQLSAAVRFLLFVFGPLHYLKLKKCITHVMKKFKDLDKYSTEDQREIFSIIPMTELNENAFMYLSASYVFRSTYLSKKKMQILFLVCYLDTYIKVPYDVMYEKFCLHLPMKALSGFTSSSSNFQAFLKNNKKYFELSHKDFLALSSDFYSNSDYVPEVQTQSSVSYAASELSAKESLTFGSQTLLEVNAKSDMLTTANADHLQPACSNKKQIFDISVYNEVCHLNKRLIEKLSEATELLVYVFDRLEYLQVMKCVMYAVSELKIFINSLSIQLRRYVFTHISQVGLDNNNYFYIKEPYTSCISTLPLKDRQRLIIVCYLDIHKKVSLEEFIDQFAKFAPPELSTGFLIDGKSEPKHYINYFRSNCMYFHLDIQNYLSLSGWFNEVLDASELSKVETNYSKRENLNTSSPTELKEHELSNVEKKICQYSDPVKNFHEQVNTLSPLEHKSSEVEGKSIQFISSQIIFKESCSGQYTTKYKQPFPQFQQENKGIRNSITGVKTQPSSSLSSESENNSVKIKVKFKKAVRRNQSTSAEKNKKIFTKLTSGISYLLKFFMFSVDLHAINVVLHVFQSTRYQFIFLSFDEKSELVNKVLTHFKIVDLHNTANSSDPLYKIDYEEKDLLLITFIISYFEKMDYREVFLKFLECKKQSTSCMWTFPDACKYFEEWEALFFIGEGGFVKLLNFPTIKFRAGDISLLNQYIPKEEASQHCSEKSHDRDNYLSLKIQQSIFYLHMFFNLKGSIELLNVIFHALMDRNEIFKLSDSHICQVVEKAFSKFLSYDSFSIDPVPSEASKSISNCRELSNCEKNLLCLIFILNEHGSMHYRKVFKLWQNFTKEIPSFAVMDKEQYHYFRKNPEHFSIDSKGNVRLVNFPSMKLVFKFKNISINKYGITFEIRNKEDAKIVNTNFKDRISQTNISAGNKIHSVDDYNLGKSTLLKTQNRVTTNKNNSVEENVFLNDKISIELLQNPKTSISCTSSIGEVKHQNGKGHSNIGTTIPSTESIIFMKSSENSGDKNYSKILFSDRANFQDTIFILKENHNIWIRKTCIAIQFLIEFFKPIVDRYLVYVILHVLSDVKKYVIGLDIFEQENFVRISISNFDLLKRSEDVSESVSQLNEEEQELLFIAYLLQQDGEIHYKHIFDKFLEHNVSLPSCVITVEEQRNYITNWNNLFSISLEGVVKLKALTAVGESFETVPVNTSSDNFRLKKTDCYKNNNIIPYSDVEANNLVENPLKNASNLIKNSETLLVTNKKDEHLKNTDSSDSIKQLCLRIKESVVFLSGRFKLVATEHIVKTIFHVLKDIQNFVVEESGFCTEALKKFTFFNDEDIEEYPEHMNNTLNLKFINQLEQELLIITFILIRSGPMLYSELYKQFTALSQHKLKQIPLKQQYDYFYLKKMFFFVNSKSEVGLIEDIHLDLSNCCLNRNEFNQTSEVASNIIEKRSMNHTQTQMNSLSERPVISLKNTIIYQITSICNDILLSRKTQSRVDFLQKAVNDQADMSTSNPTSIQKERELDLNLKQKVKLKTNYDLSQNRMVSEGFLSKEMLLKDSCNKDEPQHYRISPQGEKTTNNTNENFFSQLNSDFSQNITAPTSTSFCNPGKDDCYISELVDSMVADDFIKSQNSTEFNCVKEPFNVLKQGIEEMSIDNISSQTTSKVCNMKTFNLLEVEQEHEFCINPPIFNLKEVKRTCSSENPCLKNWTLEYRTANFCLVILGQFDDGVSLFDLTEKLVLASNEVQHYISCFYQQDLLSFIHSRKEFYVSSSNKIYLR